MEIGPQMEINLPEDPAANCDLLATGDYCLLSGEFFFVFFYAPNFEEVGGAYCFWGARPSVMLFDE